MRVPGIVDYPLSQYGMASLIEMILPEKSHLLSPQGPIVQHEDQRLVPKRHASKHIQQQIGKLALAGYPGS